MILWYNVREFMVYAAFNKAYVGVQICVLVQFIIFKEFKPKKKEISFNKQ